MLKFKVEDSESQSATVFFGLSHENLARLQKGEPIVIGAEESARLGLRPTEIVIFSGKTEAAMLKELRDRDLIPDEPYLDEH